MSDNNYSKNFFLAALFVLAVLTFLIVKPLFIALVSAGILAYIFYPVYKYLLSKTKNKMISALIIIIALAVIISIASYSMVNVLTKEGYTLFITAKQKLSSNSLVETDCVANPSLFCNFNNKIINFMRDPQVKFYLEDTISKLSSYITTETFAFISNLPLFIIDMVVMFFAIYYLLKDGTDFISKIKKAIPLKSHHVDDIIKQFDNFTFATLYGKLITSLIQGTVGGLLFFALGLSTPLIAGIVMAFFAFLPVIGTPIIWLPTAFTLLIEGSTTKGLILILGGTIMTASVDNILKPMIIGNRAHLHPAIVLVGIFGGIFLVGPIGIIVGPLIISLLISFIEVYYKEGY